MLRALFDTTAGYEGDPKLLTAFPTECRGGANCEIAQVVEGPIPFFALCEHHALPFFGNVYVGYVAHEGIIGISKLTRLVRVVTRRFGVQERMTYQICDELDRMMAPHGVAVYAEAHHLCTQMRGVRELHPKTRTTSYRGVYVDSPQLRGEFYDVSGLRRRRLLTTATTATTGPRPGETGGPSGEPGWMPSGRRRPAGPDPPRAVASSRPGCALATTASCGSRCGRDRPTVIANFVSTLDGVVAFDTEGASGGGEISGFFEPDRFVMGLLRAMADVVLVGAGTVRAAPTHEWTARHVQRASADAFALWRRRLGITTAQPTTVVVTASGVARPVASRACPRPTCRSSSSRRPPGRAGCGRPGPARTSGSRSRVAAGPSIRDASWRSPRPTARGSSCARAGRT